MSCKKDLDCIRQFLIYPQSLLSLTHKAFGYNTKISLDDTQFINLVREYYNMTKKDIKEFIKLWNTAPKYCCLPNTKRKGKCTAYPNQCNETGVQGNNRIRDLTLDELLDIKKKNNIIPKYAECLKDKDCPRKGKKKSWRDKEKDVCIEYRCGLIDKPNWNPQAPGKRFILKK
mgnify:CR=1 FL=1